LALFERLGIAPELLAEAHVQRVTDAEARDVYGITGSATKDMSGIVFPYFSISTGQRVTARIRRDNPEIEDGKEKEKYISAYGDRKHLHFPPNAKDKLQSHEMPIVLVEAEKSCLALVAWAERAGATLLPLGMGGCWGWRGRIGKVENAHGKRVDELGALADLSCCDGRKVYVLLDANVATNPKVRQAQTALVADLQKRNCETLLCDLPEVDGVNGPDDYIAVCGDDAMAQVFANAHGQAERPAEFSDDALALRFTVEHGSDLRYTAAWGRWSQWDGSRWKRDATRYAFDLARGICRMAASSCQKPHLASRIASAVTVAAVERLAQADRRHAATVEQWDADPWLLNTPAGVVDLRTGALRLANREDYVTKITNEGPGGDCPRWRAFLARVTDGNEELQRFMQRMGGYALTGITREHALFFLYGTGANGKSVFLNTIAAVLGDYAKTAPIEAFVASASEHHPTDLAGLQGARLVTAVETEDGRRWAESKLKALTGGDRIAARFMRQDFFEFAPQFKLVIAGNHKPGLRTVDEAMRRRFNLLPFTVTIPAAERDLQLADKLREEWSGILQWMIGGCLSWQREGLNAPAVVRDATAEYLAAEDALGSWLEECCVLDKCCSSTSAALFEGWKKWCEENGEQCRSQRAFSENLHSRGFARMRLAHGKRAFSGLGLRSDTAG
jgi:putative DNA primase/helicase